MFDFNYFMVFYAIVCAIIGWALIEGTLWAIQHISIVCN